MIFFIIIFIIVIVFGFIVCSLGMSRKPQFGF
jgi:hypothetical protein